MGGGVGERSGPPAEGLTVGDLDNWSEIEAAPQKRKKALQQDLSSLGMLRQGEEILQLLQDQE